MKPDAEIWKPIPGWPYEASDLGRIRNMKNGRTLKPFPCARKYLGVRLYEEGGVRFRQEYVHRLVLFAFVGQPPAGHEGEHIDDVGAHNHLSNLEWSTHAENTGRWRLRGSHWRKSHKVPNGRKHTARGVSLPPRMERHAVKRATQLDMSFSKYVQRLISIDLSRKLLSIPKEAA